MQTYFAKARPIANALKTDRFHLLAHDWGGLFAWQFASLHPKRVASLHVLAVHHPSAFTQSLKNDWEQRLKSSYIFLFRLPFHVAERMLKSANWKPLRAMYQGK